MTIRSAHIEHEIEGVEENVRDGQEALDRRGVLALHLRIVPPERFFSNCPSEGPQHHTEQPTLGSFKRQEKMRLCSMTKSHRQRKVPVAESGRTFEPQ
jgi:hypothetical protein